MPTNVTRPSPATNRGVYSVGNSYAVNDVVQYLGGSYMCISPASGIAPTNTVYWSVYVPAGAGLPSGGTSGQYLVKNSATDFDASWTTVSAATATSNLAYNYSGPYLSGMFYDNRMIAATAGSIFSLAANSVYYLPIVLPSAVTFNLIQFYSQQTTGTVNYGFSLADPSTCLPTTLISSNSSTITASNTFYSSILNYAASPGLLYLCIGSATAVNIASSGTGPRLAGGASSIALAAPSSYVNTTNLGQPMSNPSVSISGAATVPCVWMRVS